MRRARPLRLSGRIVRYAARKTGRSGRSCRRFATYYAGPNGSLCAILDRLFYSAGELLRFKPAAAVAVCRRGGASATFDRLNKYFTINNMPVVSSQYWNSVHGRLPGEATQDAEGMQTMRTLGDNMAWLLKNIQTGKIPLPEPEEPVRTNFIR